MGWGASVQLMFQHTRLKELEDKGHRELKNGGGGGRPKERVVEGHMISSSCYSSCHMFNFYTQKESFPVVNIFFLQFSFNCYLIDRQKQHFSSINGLLNFLKSPFPDLDVI